jgi:hypothetical protein
MKSFSLILILVSGFANAEVVTQNVKLVFPTPVNASQFENGAQSRSFFSKATLEIEQVETDSNSAPEQISIPVRVRLISDGINAMVNRPADLSFENSEARPLKDFFGKYIGAEIGVGAIFGANEVEMTNDQGVVAKGSHFGFAEGLRVSQKVMWLEPSLTNRAVDWGTLLNLEISAIR